MTASISIRQGHHPELPDSDVNVVIDVIRAFTTTHLAFESGAGEILLAGEVDEAFSLKEEYPDYLLAGERDAIKVEGFDLGNSPWACSQTDLDGRSMILTTTNGVRATLHALHEGLVLVTGFSNAEATAAFLRQLYERGEARRINLLASNPTGDDDLACAELLRDRILGRDGVDTEEVIERIRHCESAQKFLNPDRPRFDRRDIELCMTPRPCSFVMQVVERQGRPVIEKRALTPTGSEPSRRAR